MEESLSLVNFKSYIGGLLEALGGGFFYLQVLVADISSQELMHERPKVQCVPQIYNASISIPYLKFKI